MYSQNYYRRRQTKNNKAGIYKNIFTAFLLLVLIFFLIFSVDYLIHRGKNYSNVFALEHNIGKLNKTQTENALSPIVEELLHRSIQIKHDDYAITIVPREDLGASIDLDKLIDKAYAICRQGSVWQRIADRISLIRRAKIVTPYFDFNNSDYDDLINILKTEIEQPTRDAELKVDRIIPSQIGIEIQKQELYEEINRNLLHAANADTTDVIVEVPVKREYPE
ncbi:MAG: peptidoglycan binding domain-containing protein, partial [Candidatus Caldatribacteriota bacterium]